PAKPEPEGGKAVTPPAGPIEPPKASSEPDATGSPVAKPGFQTPAAPAGAGDLAMPGRASD
ncbi:hypothetical protein ABEX47_24025, partial [Paenibacillus ehimensis]|uniref:hypothetical protein n=1 Tax=Paenibacillus ehimensis TaxID=79264 RepID=UPI003D2E53C5